LFFFTGLQILQLHLNSLVISKITFTAKQMKRQLKAG